jgi:hypothetical protein
LPNHSIFIADRNFNDLRTTKLPLKCSLQSSSLKNHCGNENKKVLFFLAGIKTIKLVASRMTRVLK